MLQRLKRTIKKLFFPMAILFIATSFTGAYFSDSVSVSGNTFETGSWGAPAPTEPVAGDVVINEMMWMGSVGHALDEWIELRNTTSSDINISNWNITRIDSGEALMIIIPDGKTIPANGYFLISNYVKTSASSALNVDPDLVDSGVSLANTALQIKLYKGDWSIPANLIDTADDGVSIPLFGSNGTNKQSMSRKAVYGDGTVADNWYTDIVSNSATYWKTEDGNNYGNNYGTPGGPNS